MPFITIDNQEIEFEDGMTVMQACELAGVEIPRFCYHDRLSIAGNCRMCLVEMDKSPKPIASCAMPATEGMKIKTNTDSIKRARKGIMEFLLINHPLDCPICDQGGECDLQDQALHYGLDRSRYEENKRAVKNKYMGPLVGTIMTRCIHCTRCVRFSTEIAGVDDLGLLGRGENAEITTYLEKAIESELSGNVIDLCPVGALTNKPYAFKARPWELNKTESVDIFDAMGSSIRIDTLGKKTLRVLPRLNEEINEEWISDKSRFAIDGLSKERIDIPYIKRNGKLISTEWDEVLNRITQEISKHGKENTLALSGKFTDIETLFATKYFVQSLGSNFFDCRYDNAQFIENQRSSYLFNSSIQEIDNAEVILLVGTNPRWEASVLNARIRKSYINNDCKIGLIGKKIDLTYEYSHLSDNIEHLNDLLNDRSPFSELLKNSKKSLMIIGNSAINFRDGKEVLNVCSEIAKKYNISTNNFNGFNVLQQDISKAGAIDIGFYNNDFAQNFDQKIKDHISKFNPVVFLLSCDEINHSILEGAFIVYLGHHGDVLAQLANVVLPTPAYTEKSSTYVNMEGRVLQTTRCYHPLGESKEEWKIFRSLSNNFSQKLRFNNLSELRNEISNLFPVFKEINNLPSSSKLDFGSATKIENRVLEYNIKNFYMTDVISRASITMANCSREILNKVA
ncbi:MAG: NADH-quinone oxidoreductase subunit G [Pelagibacteraceae bacterium]|jgi:NADH-quinone oxidoreductase subunit G|nr:NADH-quinone oxidoreductase subunit G [Pelagibacteraceae bacterium]HJL58309.1 NADH-quinone oxidoreductase subunit NuoG [Alphaproteobacteria bacterium]MBO6467932.1 NADH-quinone oxidoreductase subunit G [Pelagibacteraceae bacterium]MBO6469602.1 NADH-quinone oxidoreductase subunit G [Pelagibacteraceae bacterium]MBO6471571.1 NADH-quinone oxidoreductase subunit G [Pelagibacteraceae bacterium]|tara:strand:+ start:817 stop:2859 length:2043 start_codon:yes stop_codon:yes gene_type:complete